MRDAAEGDFPPHRRRFRAAGGGSASGTRRQDFLGGKDFGILRNFPQFSANFHKLPQISTNYRSGRPVFPRFPQISGGRSNAECGVRNSEFGIWKVDMQLIANGRWQIAKVRPGAKLLRPPPSFGAPSSPCGRRRSGRCITLYRLYRPVPLGTGLDFFREQGETSNFEPRTGPGSGSSCARTARIGAAACPRWVGFLPRYPALRPDLPACARLCPHAIIFPGSFRTGPCGRPLFGMGIKIMTRMRTRTRTTGKGNIKQVQFGGWAAIVGGHATARFNEGRESRGGGGAVGLSGVVSGGGSVVCAAGFWVGAGLFCGASGGLPGGGCELSRPGAYVAGGIVPGAVASWAANWRRLCSTVPQRMFELGLLGILLHDSGYLKRKRGRGGNGREIHGGARSARSAEFAAKLMDGEAVWSGGDQGGGEHDFMHGHERASWTGFRSRTNWRG